MFYSLSFLVFHVTIFQETLPRVGYMCVYIYITDYSYLIVEWYSNRLTPGRSDTSDWEKEHWYILGRDKRLFSSWKRRDLDYMSSSFLFSWYRVLYSGGWSLSLTAHRHLESRSGMRLAFLLSHIHLHVAVLNQLNDFRRVCKNAKSVSFVMSVRLYVHIEQPDFSCVANPEVAKIRIFRN